ncbi:hypothetical protein BJ165DRAFT_1519758 [Panaeolus papilionaceus]|nr:hypothetical protein BJ165DRAFT_1519758 [Panaeolus papilionaceus]
MDIDKSGYTTISHLLQPVEGVSQVKLLLGGRWLLLATPVSSFLYLDLAEDTFNLRTLIPEQLERDPARKLHHGTFSLYDESDNGVFSYVLGVSYPWVHLTDENRDIDFNASESHKTLLQAWRVGHLLDTDATCVGLQASLVASATCSAHDNSTFSPFSLAISPSYLLYFNIHNDLGPKAIFQVDLDRASIDNSDAIPQPIDISAISPFDRPFDRTWAQINASFGSRMTMLYLQDNKATLVNIKTAFESRSPFPFFHLDIPSHNLPTLSITGLSQPIRIKDATRFVLCVRNEIWGVVIPNHLLENDNIDTGVETQTISLGNLPPSFPLNSVHGWECRYRHLSAYDIDQGRYVVVRFGWPDDEDDGAGALGQCSPQLIYFYVDKEGNISMNSHVGPVDPGQEDGLPDVDLDEVSLIDIDDISGKLVLYEKDVYRLVQIT